MRVVEILALNPSEVQEESLVIHEICVAPGDRVVTGDLLLVAEGAKVIFDVESPIDAIVKQVLVGPGEEVQIGKVLVILNSE